MRDTRRERIASWMLARGGIVFVAALALYAALASPYIVDGDNAELSALSAVGGAAHPSGYPTCVLWLRALSWIPVHNAAHAASLATALAAALAAWAVFAACRAWGAGALASALAAGTYATAPVILRLATEAEVFSLDQLIAALVVWLAAARGPLRGAQRAWVLAVIAGLGLGNHLMCALVAPVGVLGAVRGVREVARGRRLATAVGAVVALAVGLSAYLYLLVAPASEPSWGAVRSHGELIAHVTRAAYGGPGSFAAAGAGTDVAATTSLAAWAMTVARTWWWLPGIAGAGWLGWRCARAAPKAVAPVEPRIGWAMLALSTLLAGPVLASRFNLAPVGLGLSIVRRFHILSALLLAPAVAGALDAALARVPARWSRSRAAVALAVAAIATSAVVALPQVAAAHSPAMELGLRNMLGSLPPNAVVIATGDDKQFGVEYLQAADGVRPDVTLVGWSMVKLAWYRDRLEAQGVRIEHASDEDDFGSEPASVRVARAALAAGRPVFVDEWGASVIATLPSYPYGILFRILPAGSTLPPAADVFELNRVLFDRWELDYAPPGPDDDYATLMHDRYRRLWRILVQALVAAHDDARAQVAAAYAQRFEVAP